MLTLKAFSFLTMCFYRLCPALNNSNCVRHTIFLVLHKTNRILLLECSSLLIVISPIFQKNHIKQKVLFSKFILLYLQMLSSQEKFKTKFQKRIHRIFILPERLEQNYPRINFFVGYGNPSLLLLRNKMGSSVKFCMM